MVSFDNGFRKLNIYNIIYHWYPIYYTNISYLDKLSIEVSCHHFRPKNHRVVPSLGLWGRAKVWASISWEKIHQLAYSRGCSILNHIRRYVLNI